MGWVHQGMLHLCRKPTLYSGAPGQPRFEQAVVGVRWQCDECKSVWKVNRGMQSQTLYWAMDPVYPTTHRNSNL